MTSPWAGIFVGGAARRMGGVAKGLLPTPTGLPIVERSRGLLEREGARVVLVGEGPAYDALGIERVVDEVPGIGPLGGLVALLRLAAGAPAVALAGDMPFVSSGLIVRLLTISPQAPVVAPRREGRWEPLCARYDSTRVLAPAVTAAHSHDHSLQRLLDAAGALELVLLPEERSQLDDWDTPADVVSRVGDS